MKHGYYVIIESSGEGVRKKIDMQIEEFSKYMNFTKINIPEKENNLIQKIKRIMPMEGSGYDFDYALNEIKVPTFIYIRKGNIDADFLRFLRKLKNKYSECKIVMELPVYPYYKEMFSKSLKRKLKNIPIVIKDILYRGKLKKYIDYVATFSEDAEIFGIPTLRIYNGIDVSSVEPIHNNILDSTIDIFAVALLAPQHGYERIIKGMGDYYINGGERDIKFHIVGYGNEIERYKELIRKYKLESRVILYGRQIGTDLDQLYEKADIGVTHLAMYKVKRPLGSFIKTGEYLAKGLPMITGCRVDILDYNDFKYFLEFENNDSPIDMEKVISFYDEIYNNKDKSEVIGTCREYALKKADMSVVLKNITDYMCKM